MSTARQCKRKARELFRLSRVHGLLDPNRVHRIVQGLIATPRRDTIPVLTEYVRLVRLDLAQHTANIQSAVPAAPEFLADLESRLAQVYGPGLTTAFVARPELIGGLRIQVGCDVYDGSVAGALASLEKSF